MKRKSIREFQIHAITNPNNHSNAEQSTAKRVRKNWNAEHTFVKKNKNCNSISLQGNKLRDKHIKDPKQADIINKTEFNQNKKDKISLDIQKILYNASQQDTLNAETKSLKRRIILNLTYIRVRSLLGA